MSEELKSTAPGASLALLEALGIGPVWVRRELALVEAGAVTAGVTAGVTAVVAEPVAVQSSAVVPVAAAAAAAAAASAPRLQAARAVADDAGDAGDGPPAWLDEVDFAASMEPMLLPGSQDDGQEAAAPEVDPMLARVALMDWPALQETVSACRRCGLCNGRKNTVFGVGDAKAKWLFIGEGPGRNEDAQGEPFVGPAGKLLDNMLLAMGLKRGDNAYIANIVKCRPTGDDGRDRPPTPQEVAACLPYLQRQIALVQPTMLVALGKTAAIALLGADPATPVARLRGKVHRYGDLPLVVTYHPAYLLRTLADKGRAWADLCLAMSTQATSA